MDCVEMEGVDSYGKLKHLKDAYTAIAWYADHQTHFAGNPFAANSEAGEKAY